MHGILVIDKPAGITSATVVGRVKRLLRAKRVGHTGTLDPMATGVLPICIGQATKLAGYLLAEDKHYEGEFELGIETNTLDARGTETLRRLSEAESVTAAQLHVAVADLIGPISQVPPMYSALKHQGKRLYKLARQGEVVERPPRDITVHKFDIHSLVGRRVRFSVHASKGTYVRCLARDVGEALGCGAHLTALRRTRSGEFALAAAIPLEEVSLEIATERLISPADAIPHVPMFCVPEARVPDVSNGKRLPWSQVFEKTDAPTGLFQIQTEGGSLLALAKLEQELLRYVRVFTYDLT